jgi:predicted nucleic acid-binding protein
MKYGDTGGQAIRVYLDTSILVGYILDKGEYKRRIEATLDSLKHSSYRIIVPQIVLGEAMTIMMKKGGTHAHNKCSAIVHKLNCIGVDSLHDMPAVKAEMAKTASIIRKEVNENRKSTTSIDETDSMILAQVLSDPYSDLFLTTDATMLESDVLLKRGLSAAPGRKNSLKIRYGLSQR